MSPFTQGSLPHTDPRALRVEPSGNVHRSQFLEEQFGRVGDMDLGDFRFVAARSALERVFLEVPNLSLSSNTWQSRFSATLPNMHCRIAQNMCSRLRQQRKGKFGHLRNRCHQPADITYMHSEGI